VVEVPRGDGANDSGLFSLLILLVLVTTIISLATTIISLATLVLVGDARWWGAQDYTCDSVDLQQKTY